MPRPLPILLALLAGARAQGVTVTLISQQREIVAELSFNEQVVTRAATDFAPFVATAQAQTTFPAAGGGTGTNQAVATINCLVDPNAVRASGSLTALGGFTLQGTEPSPVFGEAQALVVVVFEVDGPTAYRMTADPRPSTNPDDEFEVELGQVGGPILYRITALDPPTAVDASGVLAAGRYRVQYQVEITGDAARADASYGFNFTLSSPCGPADIGGTGGSQGWDNRLDSNDFIAFIDLFFANAPAADLGGTGGIAQPDGLLDNNDFIVFIDRFFDGPVSCR